METTNELETREGFISMEIKKKQIGKIFFIQYGEILGFELGLLISYHFLDFNFWIFQAILFAIFIPVLISKYNKPITKIRFDKDKKIVKFYQNRFMIYEKEYRIPFSSLSVAIKWKWLLNYYSKVIEVFDDKKLLIVLPMNGYLWKKNDIDKILREFEELKVLEKQ